MKGFKLFLGVVAVSLVLPLTSATAGLVTYFFSAGHERETTDTGTPIDASDFLLSASSTLSGTFSYDSSAPYVADFGPYSVYAPAGLGLSATVEGHSLTSNTMAGLVADDQDFGNGALDMVVLSANSANPANGFAGFSVGDYVLTQFLFFFSDYEAGVLSTEILPASLLDAGFDYVGLQLTFLNSQGEERRVIFNPASLSEVSVPEPGVFLFLIAGAVMLIAVARRRLPRREFGILPLA